MNCHFTHTPCEYINCGLWDEALQACRFVLTVNKMLNGNGATPRPAHLTPTEHDILELICEGHSNKQIAATLSCGAQTVRNHVSAVLWKLGATNRTQAASIALKTGIIPLNIEKSLTQ